MMIERFRSGLVEVLFGFKSPRRRLLPPLIPNRCGKPSKPDIFNSPVWGFAFKPSRAFGRFSFYIS